MPLLTDKQAYAAMFVFLEQLYLRTKSDDLGGFLGGMSMLKDGTTADPAVMKDWEEAVNSALNGSEPGKLEIKGSN